MVALVFSDRNGARRTANVPRALKQVRTLELCESRQVAALGSPSLIVLMVSMDVKQY